MTGSSISTQNQAFNAILFLYKKVLKTETGEISALRAKRRVRVLVALAAEEAKRLLPGMREAAASQASLLYGCG